MSITIDRFLETVSDYKVNLIAGKSGISNIIEWFHMVENPFEIEHINEKELVFSSGMSMDTESNFMDFLEQLVARKGSGLVVAYGNYLKCISDQVKKFCNERGFPLMLVAYSVNVSNITKLLSIQLLESEKINRQLFSAMKNAISFPEKTEGYLPTLLQYGFRKNETYAVTIIKLKHLELISSSEIQWIVKSMESQLLSAGDKSFVLTMDDIFVFVFSNYSEEEIKAIMLKIIMLLRMKEYKFFVGSSVNHLGMQKLSQAYVQAKKVVNLSGRKGWGNIMIQYSELGVYQLLLAIDNKETIKAYYNDMLGKLEENDQNNGTDYLDFLNAYLNSNCNINDTADALFIHRNTVVYKIKKINELLDCDLSDIEVRVQLYLAAMVRNII
ncbi:MAG: helix-turn-helix domain-containing protein [Peptococcaceae bacterium]|jgi:hypothetical protein|nr:helix-turn-helix domain-containing protein [Peptococcaceae bacterium]